MIFPANLNVKRLYEFHLMFVLNISFNRRSRQGAAIKEYRFIAIGVNPVSALGDDETLCFVFNAASQIYSYICSSS